MAKMLRGGVTDYILGIILALLLFLGGSEAWRIYRVNTIYAVPAVAFFEPLQLAIPDFNLKSDPIIFYDRVIHQEFSATWIVEIQLIQSDGSPISVCDATGSNIYQPEKKQPVGGSHLFAWFMGKECDLGVGTYRAVANWVIARPGAAGDVTTRINSNLFKVMS